MKRKKVGTAFRKTRPKPKPRHIRGSRQIKVDAAEWESLRIRSRTLAALNEGGGLPCPKCGDCLIVRGSCPGCNHTPNTGG